MNLASALGLKVGESIAFVGAGGKTSAMFSLARELDSPVILTTTTHLGDWQAKLADEHKIIRTPEEIHPEIAGENRILLVTGSQGDDSRLQGIGGETLRKLQMLCKQKQISLLIEADGAKQRPLKAPAEYEPLIPLGVDRVVVIAGLAGLGKPLDAKIVHRPEIFSRLSGLQEGATIRVEDLAGVLRSDLGGMKGIPDGAEKILFLNQADDTRLMAQGGRLARQLRHFYDRVLVGSLHQQDPSEVIFSVYSETAGVILAAGGSERLRKPKQLLSWEGKPFVHVIAKNALEAGLSPLIIITGAFHDQVAKAVENLPVEVVQNQRWQDGQSISMKAGLKALPENCDSVMFLLSDQPQIPSELITQLQERYACNRKPITAPLINGHRGNPLLFNRKTFAALEAVDGDRGGRAVLTQFEVDWLPWEDRRVLMDVDQEGDYERLKNAYFKSE